jgi:3-(3-hydroxy-phenyl)propionate hydroxylase
MPPFLGQGMCSGIKDAANLSWKLDFVLRGFATDSLLNTYESERKPYVEKVIESDLWLSNMIQTTNPETAMQRDQHLSSLPPSERKLNAPIIKLGGAVFDHADLYGLPVPQPITNANVKHDDLLGEHLTLIGEAFVPESIKKLVAMDLIKLIQEPSEQMQDWLNKNNTKAVLIRPDRYVQAKINHPNDLEKALNDLSIIYRN